MEIQNTLENKAKFFAQYWGQNVLDFNDSGAISTVRYEVQGDIDEYMYLELTNIDNITDEHANILGFENAADFFINGSMHAMFDDLRLLGYAVDWSDLSVTEINEFGWIKLK